LPQRVNCHGCGAILYEGKELKSPEEILQIHGGKCPKCGRTLSLIPKKIEVKTAPNMNLEKYMSNIGKKIKKKCRKDWSN